MNPMMRCAEALGFRPRLRVTVVWMLLILATLLSWDSARHSATHRLLASAVLVIAFVKARLIGVEFMELRVAPIALRAAFELWAIGACAVLLALYWLHPAL